MSPVINWNNHILFVWITAEYKTGSSESKEQLTSVTVWDAIIPREKKNLHHINIQNMLFEYPIVDYYSSLL